MEKNIREVSREKVQEALLVVFLVLFIDVLVATGSWYLIEAVLEVIIWKGR
jgi:hypothetical protein